MSYTDKELERYRTMMAVMALIGLLFLLISPFVAFINLGAATLFFFVGLLIVIAIWFAWS